MPGPAKPNIFSTSVSGRKVYKNVLVFPECVARWECKLIMDGSLGTEAQATYRPGMAFSMHFSRAIRT